MSEMRAIARAARALRQGGEPFLLATVVAVRGSSYRRPGARLIIADDRRVAGSVSGGCLEHELIQRGWWHTRDGAPALLAFDSRSGAEIDGDSAHARTGCGGVVEILLERVAPDGGRHPLELVEAAVARETTIEMLTVYRSAHAQIPVGARRVIAAGAGAGQPSTDATPPAFAALIERGRRALGDGGARFANVSSPDGAVHALVERLQPPPHLFVLGSGPDAVPVVHLAATLGWTCTVWDRLARAGSRARFAAADHVYGGELDQVRARVAAAGRPLAVVMSHDFESDAQALAMLLPSRALYIGVLGPWRRTERLLAALPAGLSAARDQRGRRLHAPVGLAIGAETPDEIALSIVAEAQAALAGLATSSRAAERSPAVHAPPGRKPARERIALREVAR